MEHADDEFEGQVGRGMWRNDPGSGAIKTVGRAWSTWLGIDYRQIDNESFVWSSRCGYK
jgi:hypothetical protein